MIGSHPGSERTSQQMLMLKGCVRCGGDLKPDDGEWQCLQCGHYFYGGVPHQSELAPNGLGEPITPLKTQPVAGSDWLGETIQVMNLVKPRRKPSVVAQSRATRASRPKVNSREGR